MPPVTWSASRPVNAEVRASWSEPSRRSGLTATRASLVIDHALIQRWYRGEFAILKHKSRAVISLEGVFTAVMGFTLIGGTVFGVPTWYVGRLTGSSTSLSRMTAIGALWGTVLTTTFLLWRWRTGPPFGGGGPGMPAITSEVHNATLIFLWALFAAVVGAGAGAVVAICQRRKISGWVVAGTMLLLSVAFLVMFASL